MDFLNEFYAHPHTQVRKILLKQNSYFCGIQFFMSSIPIVQECKKMTQLHYSVNAYLNIIYIYIYESPPKVLKRKVLNNPW